MDSNKWRLNNVKSIRVSDELLEMLEREVAARNTTLSAYARFAMILQMKFGNRPHLTEHVA
jgi:hypothetical protein